MSAPSSSRRAHRLSLAACACLVALASITAGPVLAGDGGGGVAEGRTWQFDIPPQGLGSALQRWSAVTGIDWAHVGGNFSGVASPGVSGAATAAEALDQLLAGTGYAYSVLPNGSISIVQTGPVESIAEVTT